MKHQAILIGGGEAFDSDEQYYAYLETKPYDPFEKRRGWKDWIEWALSEEFETMMPAMPNKQNADYRSWKIWFEKLFPYLNDQKLILIGHSLGGIFLAKYLSENKFPKTIDQLHLVAAVFNAQGLVGETIGDFVLDTSLIPRIANQAKQVYIYHSKDDPMVPFSHSEEYMKYLPNANLIAFEDRGHFRQPAFPELLDKILNLNTQ